MDAALDWSTIVLLVDGSRDISRPHERDRVLVQRAQAGDRAALGELLQAHGASLYRTLLLPRLGSEAAAQDALAETYKKVVLKLGQFSWQDHGFYPWLRTIALRVALDQLRARRRTAVWQVEDMAREVDAASTATPLDQQLCNHRDRQAVRQKLDDALARIHPRYAQAIRLCILEELPREEVAAKLGVTASTFDVLLHRATQALKKTLQAEGMQGDDDGTAQPPRPRVAKDMDHG